MIPTPLAWAHSRARSHRELVSKPIAGGRARLCPLCDAARAPARSRRSTRRRKRGAPPPQRAENARRGPRPRPAAGPSPVTALVGPRRPWGCSRTGPAPDTVLKPVLVISDSIIDRRRGRGLRSLVRRAHRLASTRRRSTACCEPWSTRELRARSSNQPGEQCFPTNAAQT